MVIDGSTYKQIFDKIHEMELSDYVICCGYDCQCVLNILLRIEFDKYSDLYNAIEKILESNNYWIDSEVYGGFFRFKNPYTGKIAQLMKLDIKRK